MMQSNNHHETTPNTYRECTENCPSWIHRDWAYFATSQQIPYFRAVPNTRWKEGKLGRGNIWKITRPYITLRLEQPCISLVAQVLSLIVYPHYRLYIYYKSHWTGNQIITRLMVKPCQRPPFSCAHPKIMFWHGLNLPQKSSSEPVHMCHSHISCKKKKTFFSMKPTYFMVKILAIDPSSGCWAKANKVSTGSCGTPWASNVTCPHFVEDLINKLEVPKMGIPQNRYFLFDGKS